MIYPCDVCGATKAIEVPHVREYTNGQVIHICKACGFVYVKERRSSQEIADAWTTKMFGKQYNPGTPLMVARHNYIAEFIHQSIDLHDKAICDVGAGNGQFLGIARRYYARVYGIEPSEANCYAMSNKNIPFFNGTIEDCNKSGRFDIVTLMWTLENTAEPNEMLSKCRDLLFDGHLVVATGSRLLVPYAKPLDLYLSENPVDTHPSRFSINTLTAMLNKHGFRVDFINECLNDSITLCVIAKKIEIPNPQYIKIIGDDCQDVWNHFDTWHYLTKRWEGTENEYR